MRHFFATPIRLRIIGTLLICSSFSIILGWFLWLVPMMQRFDPVWEEGFSARAYWNGVQERIQRYGWMHDDFGIIGSYGDKSWAEWILKRAEGGEEIGDCGTVGHKADALTFITGNNPAGTNWTVEPYWLAWWSTNKVRSQVDWIQAGLRQYGVAVHAPATADEYEPLLALLGSAGTNASEKIPPFIRYNAFRWLRDSGFDAIPFALSNVTLQTPEIIRNGLITYAKYERVFSKKDGIGLLEFAPPQSQGGNVDRPKVFSREVQIPVYLLMIFPFLIGVAVISRSFQIPGAKDKT